ncbi:MAG: class IV adenylate cyclase [Bacillota bacterium]
MSVEIEAKMKVDNEVSMVARLKDHGATPVGRFLEINTFYDTEDRALLAADEGLRLRISKNLSTGQTQCILTHKGPNRHGQLKTREETEVEVGNAEAADRLMDRLGYARCLSFEKRRHSWKLEDCKIELDEVPRLGFFLEIEGPSEESVMRVRNTLGLSDRPLIKASYIAMLASHLQERGETATAIVFPPEADQHIAQAG